MYRLAGCPHRVNCIRVKSLYVTYKLIYLPYSDQQQDIAIYNILLKFRLNMALQVIPLTSNS